MIYFIQGVSGGSIKIGYSKDIESRIKSLQFHSPVQLTVVGWMEGSVELERQLHKVFSSHRLWGEWFSPDESILDYIRCNCEKLPVPEGVSTKKTTHLNFRVSEETNKRLRAVTKVSGKTITSLTIEIMEYCCKKMHDPSCVKEILGGMSDEKAQFISDGLRRLHDDHMAEKMKCVRSVLL